jgi:AraC-like DNA-binding protein
MGFVIGMLSGLLANGADPSRLLLDAGINPNDLSDPNARVPIGSYAALYNLVVKELDDEGFGLFSVPLKIGTFEFLCRSVVSSRTLEEALDRSARFLRLLLPELRLTISRERAAARIEICETSRLGHSSDDPRRVFAFEWLLRLIHGLSCWLVGRSLSLDFVQFPYPRPYHADDYALIYTAHSSFDSSSLTAGLNANLFDLPISRDEEALANFLSGAPGKITMLYRRDRETVRQVRDILARALPKPVSLEYVADRLHLSSRTLHRRLHGEGSSFRAIKDAVRRDIALSKIEKKRQPIGQIASDLGYSESSAFFRAFRKWTGKAPTKYRRRGAA